MRGNLYNNQEEYAMLPKLLAAVLVLHPLFPAASKELEKQKEELLAKALYERTNLLTQEKDQSTWVLTKKPKEEAFIIFKQAAEAEPERETMTRWGREFPAGAFTLRERFTYSLDEYRRGSNFGYVEVLEPDTNKVLFSWPMFCRTTEGMFFYRTYCWARMHNGNTYETERNFQIDEILLPLSDRKRILTQEGRVPFDVEDRQKERQK